MRKIIRQIHIDGNIAFIHLTRGYVATIDAQDVHLVDGSNWSALVRFKKNGDLRTVYAITNVAHGIGKQKMVFLHRLLLGNPVALHCDHIDGNGLNNRRSNLRIATPAQNVSNQRLHIDTESGLKGVFRSKGRRKWQSAIVKNGSRFYLGSFETKEEAHAAYCKASRHLHGEFGRFE